MSLLAPVSPKSRAFSQGQHGDVVMSVAFSPDGRTLASGGWDGSIKLWDISDGKPKLKRALRGDWDEVEAVAFTPDGSAIVGLGTGFDGVPFGVVTTWAIGAGNGRTLVREVGKIDAMAFSPDGRTLATGSGDRRVVTLWEIPTGRERVSIWDHNGPIRSVAFSPDGRSLAVASGVVPAADTSASGRSGGIQIWDVSGTKVRARAQICGHEHGVLSVSYSPDGSLFASGGFDRVAKLWDAKSASERFTLDGHRGWVATVAFSPDGSLLATGSHDHTIKLWDTTTAREVDTLTGHTGYVYSVAFSPDGSLLASGSLDGTVRLWSIERLASESTEMQNGRKPRRRTKSSMKREMLV